MYKDKDKQREANRQASQRRRDKGMTQGVINEAVVIPDHPVPVIPKRGKDIKCFADLPPDVQQTIDRLSTVVNGVGVRYIDKTIKANQTAIAISYQHRFPESYELGTIELMRAEADYNGICT